MISASATVYGFHFRGAVEPYFSGSHFHPPEGGLDSMEMVGIDSEREVCVWLEGSGEPWKLLCARWVQRYGELPRCCESAVQRELEDDAAHALEQDASEAPEYHD